MGVSIHREEDESVRRNSRYDAGAEVGKLAIDFEGWAVISEACVG